PRPHCNRETEGSAEELRTEAGRSMDTVAQKPYCKLNVSDLTSEHGAKPMTFTLNAAMLQPIVALLAGILILLIPRILNFIVAIYLIFVGVTGLWPHLLSAHPH